MKNSKLWMLVLPLYLTQIFINNKIYCDENNEPIITSRSVDISNPNYIQQISCEERKCHKLELTDVNLNDIQDQVFDLMGKEAGKIFVEVQENPNTITDEKNEVWLKYLREIANRKGRVIFEPIYIQTRDMSFNDIPIYGGYFKLGSSIYSRFNSILIYGRMEHYNAKVLFHPKTHHIMAYFFVHKNYGSICKTVFSNCNSIEYIDDDVFDFQLEEALSKTKENFFIVEFTNTKANLPFFRMEVEALLEVNKSSRLYKWLVASKVSEAKPIVQERFLTVPIAIKIIDYSLSAYDLVQSIRMYSSARSWKATTYFEESAEGKAIKSVHFERITEER
ncbi:MAG: hypothetical protein MH321_10080 [Leptospiraceae bacterium]|nr:hypothetical protein [Leptospiraceae bacterium]